MARGNSEEERMTPFKMSVEEAQERALDLMHRGYH